MEPNIFNCAMCCAEVGLCGDPKRCHWMAIVLHKFENDFILKCSMFYVGRIAYKLAHAQGNRYGIDVSHLLMGDRN